MDEYSKKVLRVGVLGCGDIFNSHSQAYPDHPYAVVIGFYDRIQVRAMAWYKRMKDFMDMVYEAYEDEDEEDLDEEELCLLEKVKLFKREAKVYNSAKDLIAACDVIDVCTPNYAHGPYAAWALKMGKSVMVEKPPARLSLETQWIVDVAEKSKGFYQANENFLWQAYVEKTHEVVRQGQIGEIHELKTSLGHSGPSWGFNNHFLNPSLSGGGCMSDMGIHTIGLGYGILGKSYEVKDICAVQLKSGTIPERTMRDSDGWNVYAIKRFLVEDDAITKVTMTDKTTGNEIPWLIESSWSRKMESVEIIGEKGKLRLETNDRMQKFLAFYDTEDNRTEIALPPQGRDSHVLQCIEFCNRLLEKKPARVDHKWAHQMQMIISGTYYSWLKGYEAYRQENPRETMKLDAPPFEGTKISPADLDTYYQTFMDAQIPKTILLEDIVYDLMRPFTHHYFSPGKRYERETD